MDFKIMVNVDANTPLAEFHFSSEFSELIRVNNFETLNDILRVPLHKFHQLPRSGYRLLREWVNFLEGNGLMTVVKR